LSLKGCRPGLAIVLLSLLPLSGCLLPNKELVRLQDSVAKLSRENMELSNKIRQTALDRSSDLKRIEGDLSSIKSEIAQDIASMQKGQKRSGADQLAELDVIRADFQSLIGRFDDVKHTLDQAIIERASYDDALNERIKAIEEKLAGLEAEITGIKTAAAAQPAKEERSIKPELAPNELYKTALDAIMNGKTKAARVKFREYLLHYSDQPLANNAQYWLAESYYGENEYERAIIEYDEVIKKYPQGGKVPAALLKQGMAFENINDRKSAVAIYKKLVKGYPGSEEAAAANKKISAPKKKAQ